MSPVPRRERAEPAPPVSPVPRRKRAGPAPPARPKPNVHLAGLLETAQDEAGRAAVAIGAATPHLAKALAHTLELRRLCDADDAASAGLAAAYAEAGIKLTKRTLNPFTPLVKLVFGRKLSRTDGGRELPSTDVSRYANALWLADKRRVEPEDLAAFFKKANGVTACAEQAAKERRAGTRNAPGPLAMEEALEAQRKRAERVKMPFLGVALGVPPGAKLVTVLLERVPDGGFLVLGARPATPGSARRYLPARRG
jgi:hypothetical protein